MLLLLWLMAVQPQNFFNDIYNTRFSDLFNWLSQPFLFAFYNILKPASLIKILHWKRRFDTAL